MASARSCSQCAGPNPGWKCSYCGTVFGEEPQNSTADHNASMWLMYQQYAMAQQMYNADKRRGMERTGHSMSSILGILSGLTGSTGPR